MDSYRQRDRGPHPLAPWIITSGYRFPRLAGMDPLMKLLEPLGQIASGRGLYDPL